MTGVGIPERSVVIDCFPESLSRYRDGYTIVAVDVFRATTTALTALVLGRRCFPVPTLEAAVALAERMPGALLAGELGGYTPYGFSLDNSPAALADRSDVERPLILLSTAGTRVICGAQPQQAVYVACLRNHGAQAEHLAAHHPRVALVGAGARGEFREEDALCCAWIAAALVDRGYEVEGRYTESLIDRWRSAPVTAVAEGRSAEFLREIGCERDITFVLDHVDDVRAAARLVDGELALVPTSDEVPATGAR